MMNKYEKIRNMFGMQRPIMEQPEETMDMYSSGTTISDEERRRLMEDMQEEDQVPAEDKIRSMKEDMLRKYLGD